MNNHCSKCNRRFPWGISAQDGVCFICRWPKLWSASDEDTYQTNLKKAAPAKAEKAKEETA